MLTGLILKVSVVEPVLVKRWIIDKNKKAPLAGFLPVKVETWPSGA
jgi:hypothetical protein